MKRKRSQRLARDGAYGQPINGYQGDGKVRFLRAAQALLKEVGRCLVTHGLNAGETHASSGGVAVSGEAYGWFWRPEDPSRRVYVEISAAGLGWGREDQLIVLARLETYTTVARGHSHHSSGWRRVAFGPNQWLSANLDSLELAEAVLPIFDPTTTPAVMTAVTGQARLTIPDPVVNSEAESQAWAREMHAVERAFADDNADAFQPVTASVTLPLFHTLDDATHSDGLR